MAEPRLITAVGDVPPSLARVEEPTRAPLRSSSDRTARWWPRPASSTFPTCWDQWFRELARAYSLGGAEVIVYPTAIGSEPDHPDFDTQLDAVE